MYLDFRLILLWVVEEKGKHPYLLFSEISVSRHAQLRKSWISGTFGTMALPRIQKHILTNVRAVDLYGNRRRHRGHGMAYPAEGQARGPGVRVSAPLFYLPATDLENWMARQLFQYQNAAFRLATRANSCGRSFSRIADVVARPGANYGRRLQVSITFRPMRMGTQILGNSSNRYNSCWRHIRRGNCRSEVPTSSKGGLLSPAYRNESKLCKSDAINDVG